MTDEDDQGVFEISVSDDPRYEAEFLDDGEVAYGYMLCDGKIIADVWLYNVGDAPDVLRKSPVDSDGYPKMPFANLRDYVRPGSFERVASNDEISFNWSYSTDGTVEAVEFWIRGRRHARVTPGSKPGWCVLATRDGPMARKLD